MRQETIRERQREYCLRHDPRGSLQSCYMSLITHITCSWHVFFKLTPIAVNCQKRTTLDVYIQYNKITSLSGQPPQKPSVSTVVPWGLRGLSPLFSSLSFFFLFFFFFFSSPSPFASHLPSAPLFNTPPLLHLPSLLVLFIITLLRQPLPLPPSFVGLCTPQ
jgi:hypothetical protein